MKFLALFCLMATGVGLAGCASHPTGAPPGDTAPVAAVLPSAPPASSASATPATPLVPATVAPPSTNAPLVRAEQIRADCITGRRLICGRVLEVTPKGLVVDSGYTDLLRPPLGQSWLVPGTVSAHRDPGVLELNEPGTPGIGLVFLTDIPRRKTVRQFDYVVLIGYPAGEYVYSPVPGVKKTVRKFAAGLDTAVKLNLADEEKEASPAASTAK